jgi:probable DNA metabolism protein
MPAVADVIYCYDETFEGLLCCVFESYAEKELPYSICTMNEPQASLLPLKKIVTDAAKAERVAVSIPKKIGYGALELVQKAFLTCLPDKELQILRFLRKGYRFGPSMLSFAGDETVHVLTTAVKHLDNESHLLKGFIRFTVQNNILVSTIGPKNYVLPFLAHHFSERYPEEHILICDTVHSMALVYRPYESAIIPMNAFCMMPPDVEEQKFRQLWQTFYDSIEIKSRHNEKCRMTLMPKRYWKYMTEFARTSGCGMTRTEGTYTAAEIDKRTRKIEG